MFGNHEVRPDNFDFPSPVLVLGHSLFPYKNCGAGTVPYDGNKEEAVFRLLVLQVDGLPEKADLVMRARGKTGYLAVR